MFKVIVVSAFIAGLGISTVSAAETAEPFKVLRIGQQKILADANGESLYTYDPDHPGQSTCTALCTVLWPPYVAPANATVKRPFSTVRRGDGSMQWAYKGAPLYSYRFDVRPGNTAGDGLEGVWHLAKP